jgi:hypothetical protein
MDGEQALRDSELSYRRLFEAAKDGILILDFETGCIRDVNLFWWICWAFRMVKWSEEPSVNSVYSGILSLIERFWSDCSKTVMCGMTTCHSKRGITGTLRWRWWVVTRN